MENPEETDFIAIPVEWYIPDDIEPGYATNLTVQHTEHEFTISFFRAIPPIIVGSSEEQREQVKELKSVRAECLAQVIIAVGRMPEFVDVLQKNLEQHSSRFKRTEETNE